MVSVTELIESTAPETLASPSNLRLGRQIVAEGGVELIEFSPLRLRALVGKVSSAPQRRTVELVAAETGLTWSCTCTRRSDLFCKHCVAAAVVSRTHAPAPKT